MPTYDYRCRDCGHVIEVIHGMTEDGPSACEVCGGALRRVIFPSGIIFKGSGFYRNDSRRGSGEGSGGEASGGEASGRAAGSGTGQPPKPAEPAGSDAPSAGSTPSGGTSPTTTPASTPKKDAPSA